MVWTLFPQQMEAGQRRRLGSRGLVLTKQTGPIKAAPQPDRFPLSSPQVIYWRPTSHLSATCRSLLFNSKTAVCPSSRRLESQPLPPKCKNTPPPSGCGYSRSGCLRCLRSVAPPPDPSTAPLGKVCPLCPHSKTIYVTAGS